AQLVHPDALDEHEWQGVCQRGGRQVSGENGGSACFWLSACRRTEAGGAPRGGNAAPIILPEGAKSFHSCGTSMAFPMHSLWEEPWSREKRGRHGQSSEHGRTLVPPRRRTDGLFELRGSGLGDRSAACRRHGLGARADPCPGRGVAVRRGP